VILLFLLAYMLVSCAVTLYISRVFAACGCDGSWVYRRGSCGDAGQNLVIIVDFSHGTSMMPFCHCCCCCDAKHLHSCTYLFKVQRGVLSFKEVRVQLSSNACSCDRM
jgi:hypothetical protein